MKRMVKVYFQRFNKLSGQPEGHELVAVIAAEESNPAAQGGLNGALEYAWMRSQNIWGSWSRGEFFENGEPNQDFSPNVLVAKALAMHDGKPIGHRSSMIGDIFEIDGVKYEAVGCGFKELVA